jgi:hypothetical protein
MRYREAVFVDSGAWIALALVRDPVHEAARERWTRLRDAAARLHTSIPVVLETFTFLDRNASRDAALAWKEAISKPGLVKLLSCGPADLDIAWTYFRRRDLHKLSAVDATSFALMRRAKIRRAFAFDHHFSTAGFDLVA